MPLRRIPSLNWLRVFEAAARMGSFSGAARLLNMSPPAVSQQIKALEGYLDATLFERGAKSVSLTDAGRAFLPTVRQSLLSVETTAASLFGHASGAPLTVQATLIFASSWLAPRLAHFARRHPDIQPHIMGVHGDSDPAGEAPDLSILFGPAPRGWGDYDRLFGEWLTPVAHPDIARTIGRPEDLLAHRLIEISSHRTSWIQLLETAGGLDLAQARFCFADTSQVSLAMAAGGFGIALARAPATDGLVEAYGLKPCLEGFRIQGSEFYHLAYRARAALSPAASKFRDWLLDEAAL